MPDIEIRLLGRIVARQKVSFGQYFLFYFKAIITGKDKEVDDFYKDRYSKRSIMEIWSHTQDIIRDPIAMKKFNGKRVLRPIVFVDIHERLTKFYDPKALLSKDQIFELHCRDFINRHAISDKAYLKVPVFNLY